MTQGNQPRSTRIGLSWRAWKAAHPEASGSRATPRRVTRTLRDAGFRPPGRRRPEGFHVAWRDDSQVVIVEHAGAAAPPRSATRSPSTGRP
jgi:hypothetical protein